METVVSPEMRIALLLLKDFSTLHTITSIGKELSMTRSGVWKVLKRLEHEKYIVMKSTGKETSLVIPKLNFKNELLDKYLDLSLSKEATAYERWIFNFKEVKEQVRFFILFGSILIDHKKANDIDVIGVIQKQNNFKKLHQSIYKIQLSETKHIHAINFTPTEFRHELLKPNKAFIEAVKKGAVLFGQEEFITFLKKMYNE